MNANKENQVMCSYFYFCLPESAFELPWADSLYTNCARMEKSFGILCFSKMVIHWRNPLSIITLGCKPVMLRKNLIKYHNNCISTYQYLGFIDRNYIDNSWSQYLLEAMIFAWDIPSIVRPVFNWQVNFIRASFNESYNIWMYTTIVFTSHVVIIMIYFLVFIVNMYLPNKFFLSTLILLDASLS